MTIQQVLAKNKNTEIEILLSVVLKKSREFLYLNGEYRLTRIEENRLTRMVARRLKGEPVAYILGYKYFMGLRFKVNKNVLVPRPETEELVEHILGVILRLSSHHVASRRISTKEEILRASDALRALQDDAGVVRILDVGTGSGCIIISIAKSLKAISYKLKPKYYASDISSKALKVAKQNAKRILGKNYNTSKYRRISFLKSDLLKNIKGNFDIIVANLPYVPIADFRLLDADLKYEPKNAIFAKKNGLAVISKFLEQLGQSKIINHKSKIFLEFDPRQKIELNSLIKKTLPSYKARFFKDLSNRWRFVEISPKGVS